MKINQSPYSTTYLLMASGNAIQSWYSILESGLEENILVETKRKQVIQDLYLAAFMGGEL